MLQVGEYIEQSTVVSTEKDGRNVVYVFRCDCGETFRKAARHLSPKWPVSCGCLWTVKLGNPGNGNSRHPLRGTWRMMLDRCYNPKCESYERYGAKGVTVCDRWRWGEGGLSGFDCFASDMGPRPTPKHSIDRRNNGEGYHPSNCAWATSKEQSLNRSVVKRYTHDGRTMTIEGWAAHLGVQYRALQARFYAGWPVERAICQPFRKSPEHWGLTKDERNAQRRARRRDPSGVGDGGSHDRPVGRVGDPAL